MSDVEVFGAVHSKVIPSGVRLSETAAANAARTCTDPTSTPAPRPTRWRPWGRDAFSVSPPPPTLPVPPACEPVVDPVRVIVTGYGDFENWNEALGKPNPSSVIAAQLAELGIENAVIEFRPLEVTHDSVEAFLADIAEDPPDIILSLGVGNTGKVEEQPQNWNRAGVDAEGQLITAGVISANVPERERIRTDLPVETIEEALQQALDSGELPKRTIRTDDPSIPWDYTPDQDAYLCNYLNFRLTEEYGEDADVTAGFVHVTTLTTVEEVHVILEALVDHELERREGNEPNLRSPF